MEVHHHPDLHHKPKKFKEYFLEFLMIFLAVTMGFFAENIREHFSESKKEKAYITSLVEDLKTDTANIKAEIGYSAFISKGIDSLTTELYKPQSKMNVREVYRLNLVYSRYVGFEFSDVTASQLKNGGMSFIKSQELANAISDYWLKEKDINGVADNFHIRMLSANEIAYGIFSRNYYRLPEIMDTLASHGSIQIDSSAKFIPGDSNRLAIYANKMAVLSLVLKTYYKSKLEAQLKEANSLLSYIKKEYGLKD